jgi:gelsolin
LAEFGVDSVPRQSSQTNSLPEILPTLYRLSDSSGSATFEPVEPATFSSLSSSDAFLLDHSSSSTHPAIYVWIGKSASLTEHRLAVQYAQTYAHQKQVQAEHFKASISLVKMNEGHESDNFIHAFDE